MHSNLEVIRAALEEISVSGHKNIELMKMCMDALDSEIQRQKVVTANANDKNHV